MNKILHWFDKLQTSVAVLIAILIFLFGGYAIYAHFFLNYHSSAEKYADYLEDGVPDFAKLKEINPEIIGWIRIPETGIDYPITQTDNNIKYVSTSPFLDDSIGGSIFLDYRNSSSFTDGYNILYGHKMAGDAMFSDLTKYAGKENLDSVAVEDAQAYMESHPIGYLYLDDGSTHEIDIFSSSLVSAFDPTYFTPSSELSTELLTSIEENAIASLNVEEGDHILAMTTCEMSTADGRIVVLGYIR